MFTALNKRGQSTLEYSVIIAVVVAGLVAMQLYMKRGMQGKLKQSSDDIGEQFSPTQSTADSRRKTHTVSSEDTFPGGISNANTKQTAEGGKAENYSEETVGSLKEETW